jgi:hypothetical protein
VLIVNSAQINRETYSGEQDHTQYGKHEQHKSLLTFIEVRRRLSHNQNNYCMVV